MRSFDQSTLLFAVIGHPVSHSHSPKLFNTIFRENKINAVYLAFDHRDAAPLVQSMRDLSVRGYSVTIPHKEKACSLVDEVDELAKMTGAINTIVQREKKLYGYNYDGVAALEALEDQVKDWQQRPVVFLGAGGAARGIAMAMVVAFSYKKKITFAVRTPEKAQKLVRDLQKLSCDAHVVTLKSIDKKKWKNEIVINTTPVGMTSVGMKNQEQKTIIDCSSFCRETVAYEIIYNPLETPFLKQAKKMGAQTINGLGMFLAQARLQLLSFVDLDLSQKQMLDFYTKSQS